MQNAKSVCTPLELKERLKSNPEGELSEKVNVKFYQSLIGSLMYLATSTRPDISYAVSRLSLFLSDPRKQHSIAGKRVLRYLKGTSTIGLRFTKGKHKLIGYADADWGGNLDDRKSMSGFAFILSSGVISWQSRKQPVVALSTMEAEYIALTESTREVLHLRSMLKELGFSELVVDPTVIMNDNQSSQALIKNEGHNSRTKHIDIRFHFIREAVKNNIVKIDYKPTNDMLADMFTKSLSSVKHNYCSTGLGIVDTGVNC